MNILDLNGKGKISLQDMEKLAIGVLCEGKVSLI